MIRRFSLHSRGLVCRRNSTVTRIGDVEVKVRSSVEASLVPKGYLRQLPQGMSKQHLRFLAQKWAMGQDTILLHHPSPLSRHLVFAFAEACDIEVEYIKLSRDTTESDLKQRRELVRNSNEGSDSNGSEGAMDVIFHDQAPVRAAIHGRLLVLDGLEQVERNVLPTLNNLLENREMQLDDGRFLGSPALPVHPDFKCVALSLQVPPYSGNIIDPPLRSRFQSRYVDDASTDELIDMLMGGSSSVNERQLVKIMSLHETFQGIRDRAVEEGVPLSSVAPALSVAQMRYCLGLPPHHHHHHHNNNAVNVSGDIDSPGAVARRVLRAVPALSHMRNAINPRFRETMAAASDNLFVDVQNGSDTTTAATATSPATPTGTDAKHSLTPRQAGILHDLQEDHALGQHLCLLGGKGSGKSVIARSFARHAGLTPVTFNLYSDLTSRDLLQRRLTDADGNTAWGDSPLVLAARKGQLAILDGIDRIESSALVTIQRLLQEGITTLPSGEIFQAHPAFRCMALGLPPREGQADDMRHRYVTSDLGFAYHLLEDLSVTDMASILSREDASYPRSALHQVATQLDKAGESAPELRLNLRHLLRLQRLGHATDSNGNGDKSGGLYRAVEDSLLARFLPDSDRTLFKEALRLAGVTSGGSSSTIHSASSSSSSSSSLSSAAAAAASASASGPIEMTVTDSHVTIGDVTARKRVSTDPSYVPNPLFFDNEAQLGTLRNLLHSYHKGVGGMLLVGNQGVGKNKLVDRLLHVLGAEREYMQLHRDSTVQSLTLVPSLQDGAIVYQDSVVVKAARSGRVLVVDEADKAPLEVVCILKALAEDEELVLNDGRKLISREKYGSSEIRPEDAGQITFIHPDFRLIVLANRPGMPFLGNNFYRECGDVFDSYIVDNLPLESELSLLRAYGTDVDPGVLKHIAHTFADLRALYENGDLSYPFSAREAVSVVKHVQRFPSDGVVSAVENILGFEGLTPSSRAQIARVFQNNDIPVSVDASSALSGGRKKDVRLATPLPLADALRVPLVSSSSSSSSSPSASSSSPLKMQASCSSLSAGEWQSSQLSESPLALHSSRLRQFSEEYASFWVGTEEEQHNGIRKMAAAVGEGNALHVLTTYPLELHSYINMDNTHTTAGSEPSKYVRHELLSAEMGWRLGHVTPLLAAYEGGVGIVLPELSMLLRVPTQRGRDKADIKHAAQMVTLPDLKGFIDGKGGGGGGALAWMGNAMSSSSSASPSSSSSGGDGKIRLASHATAATAPTALWKRGQTRFAMLDIASNRLAYVYLEGVGAHTGIDSLACVGISEAGGSSSSWVLRDMEGNVRRFDVPAQFMQQQGEGAFTMTADGYTNSDSCDNNSDYFLRSCNSSTVPSAGAAASAGGGALLPATTALHAAQALSDEWLLWRRGSAGAALSSSPQVVVTHTAAPSSSSTISVTERTGEQQQQNTTDDDHPSFLSPHARTQLEVCTISNSGAAVLRQIPLSKESSLNGGGAGGNPTGDLSDSAGQKQHGGGSRKSKKRTVAAAEREKVAAIASVQGPRALTAVVQADGYCRVYETDPASLEQSQSTWQRMNGEEADDGGSSGDGWGIKRISGGKGGGVDGTADPAAAAKGQADAQARAGLRDQDGWSVPKTGLDKPKHGKEDENNDPHVGGNTWAGGTGGSDTAGLGGRGGPYRLDKGHRVHQVSDAAKAAVSDESRAAAEAAAKEGLARRLDEINLGKGTFDVYLEYRSRVEKEIGQLKGTMDELSRRARERKWLHLQSHGELDDTRLVDGLTGDKLVFKRRGNPDANSAVSNSNSGTPPHQKRLHFVVDVSGSMYRFNGQDRRLERLLESMLLILESVPSSASGSDSTIEYAVSGHSGDAPDISFLDFDEVKPSNEAERYKVLEAMVAHSQFCLSGDHTCMALDIAIKQAALSKSEHSETHVFLLSDANFERYNISPKSVAAIMDKERGVNAHLILLASLGSEAQDIKQQLGERVSICMSTQDLPKVFERLLSSSVGKGL